MSLREEEGLIHGKDEEARTVVFPKPQGSEPVFNYDNQMELRWDETQYLIWDWHHRLRYVFAPRPSREGYLLTFIKDLRDNQLVLQYDGSNRLQSIEQAQVWRRFVFSYTRRNLIQNIALHVPGRQPETLVSYIYDEQDELTSVIDQSGKAIQYEYDERHRLVRETNRVGGSFYFEYDQNDRCIKSWGDGRYLERTLDYDVERGTTRVTDSLGATATFFWGPSGTVHKTVDPLGYTSQQLSTPGISQRLNGLGHPTHREYDLRGNLVKHADALGHTHSYTYNALDRCTSVTDPDGHQLRWEYDDRGDLRRFTDPLGQASTFERDSHGQITRQIDPEGRAILRRYDPGLRWYEISDGVGHFRYEYDAKGFPVLSSDNQGVIEIFETDYAGRILVRRLEDGPRMQYSYDAEGRLIRFEFLNGSVWHLEYDPFGHVKRIVDPDGHSVAFRYDTEGRRLAIVNQRGEELLTSYDPKGRVTGQRNFDGRVQAYDYDGAGQLVALHQADGTVLRRKYDACGNMVEEKMRRPESGEAGAELVASYGYDWRGRIRKASNADSTIEYTYNPAGRLIRERQNEFEIHYSYDRSSMLVGRELMNGRVGKVSFRHDRRGFLCAIGDKNGMVQELSYDMLGRVVCRSMRGEVRETFTYDERGRPCQQDVTHRGMTLVRRRYRYDVSDNLISQEDSLRGSYRWEYDALMRLAKETRNSREIDNFVLEPGHNVLSAAKERFEYGPGSVLRRISSECMLTYDDNGNLRERREGGKVTRYHHDVKGRLTRVTLPDYTEVVFKYDPLGRRIVKQSPQGRERYIWSDQTLAGIVNEGHDPIEMLIANGTWRPSVHWSGDKAEHYVCNFLGTPQEVIDSHGTVVWWGRYKAYGMLAETGGIKPHAYPLRFPGQLEDRETGLYYNHHRYYDPQAMRYLTPDPVGIIGGLNLYDYPRDPINFVDPLGLKCPNPKSIEKDPQGRWEIFEHADGSMTIVADCSRAQANIPPKGNPVLRATTHTGDTNKANYPEAILGKDNTVIVYEGCHRSAAAARGAQIPRDPDNPHLGGVPGKPGYMEFHYDPTDLPNDPNKVGIPCKDLQYPPGYPHQMP
jgi:RHS repeat-associated protein